MYGKYIHIIPSFIFHNKFFTEKPYYDVLASNNIWNTNIGIIRCLFTIYAISVRHFIVYKHLLFIAIIH
jgi:hypothetical protein